MYTLASANKQSKTKTAAKQGNNKTGSLTVQRKNNGQDTEALSRIASGSTPVNSYQFSPNASASPNLQSSHLSHLVQNSPIQAKLEIGQPNDIYEQEADRVADEVIRMPDKQHIADSSLRSIAYGHSSPNICNKPYAISHILSEGESVQREPT